MNNPLKGDNPFDDVKEAKRPNIKNKSNYSEDDIVREISKINGFVPAPKIRPKSYRKHFIIYEDNLDFLLETKQFCEKKLGKGSRVADNEIVRASLRYFNTLPEHERFKFIEESREEEGA